MPIKNRAAYPDNWKAISLRIRTIRANGRCEWVENGERCAALNHQPHPVTGSHVVLTTAHLDHNPANCAEANLKAMCQLHHLRYDARMHGQHAAETRRRKQGR